MFDKGKISKSKPRYKVFVLLVSVLPNKLAFIVFIFFCIFFQVEVILNSMALKYSNILKKNYLPVCEFQKVIFKN